MLACCLPLTVGTFIGYGFMKALDIGLTVATLPVMVLAVGIGVDYAFYIYNRLQLHLADGQPIVKALEQSILEVGTATIFTAITLAVGVATWSFSDLKFQADMGKLLAFMFMINMVMAMTVLPAFAVWLERWFPRRSPGARAGLAESLRVSDVEGTGTCCSRCGTAAVQRDGRAGTADANKPLEPTPAGHRPIAGQAMMLGAAWAGQRVVAVGEQGIVLLSDDRGRTSRQARSVPVSSTLTAVAFADARHGWAVGHWGVILASSDGGEHWGIQRMDIAEDRPLFAVHFFDAEHGVAVGLWSLVLTTADGGKTWTERTLEPPPGDKADLNLLGLFADDHGRLYATAERGMVLHSTDRGAAGAICTGYKGSFWSGIASPTAVCSSAASAAACTAVPTADSSGRLSSSTARVRSPTSPPLVGTMLLVGLDGLTASSKDAGSTSRSRCARSYSDRRIGCRRREPG